MNPFILSPHDRLEHWKSFRKDLPDHPEPEQLKMVAQYWSLAPTVKMAYDIEELINWPTPWEMISDGNWCKNSIAIGMEFTLRLSGWNANRLSLLQIRDYDLSDQMMVLYIDDSSVLNYTYGEVETYPKTKHDVIGRWRFCGKLYQSI